LLEKKYKIYVIGSSEDLDLVHEIYGHKSFLYLDNVINLIGCLDIFESIELVMKRLILYFLVVVGQVGMALPLEKKPL
jgi:hypothetical protein